MGIWEDITNSNDTNISWIKLCQNEWVTAEIQMPTESITVNIVLY